MKNSVNKFLIAKALMDEQHSFEVQAGFLSVKPSKAPQQNDIYSRLGQFITFVEGFEVSGNPFNAPGARDLFLGYKILNERLWKSYKEFAQVLGYRLSGGRSHVGPEIDQVMAQMALAIIFGVSRDIRDAILLDRQGRIIDGAQRLKAFKGLPDFPFYTVMIDYEHPDDQIPVF